MCERRPPRRPDEMSSIDVRLGSFGLTVASTLLVHRARCDLLGGVFVLATVEQSFLDVLVLTLSLV